MQSLQTNRVYVCDSDGNSAFSPRQPRKACVALSQEGTECNRIPSRSEHEYCQPHHKEYKNLYDQYKKAQARYDRLVVSESDLDLEKKGEKVECGKQTLDLRNKVNRRFFSLHANNRGHIQWILKLENEVRALESSLRSGNEDVQSPSTAEADQAIQINDPKSASVKRVRRSLLDPEIPMSALDHLAADDSVVVLKKGSISMTEWLLSRLYDVAPSLNDSVSTIMHPSREADTSGPDDADHVVRFVFRQYLLWKGDAGSLHRAHNTNSINDFLSRSPSELMDYIKFFDESFGRVDTLHFLRDAVCDHLLTPGKSTIRILGAAVATDDMQRSMPIEGWDILFTYFSNVVDWHNIELLCVKFEDLCLVMKLIALGRYGEATDNQPGWLDKENDISQECSLAIYQGFVAITKGYTDPRLPMSKTSDGIKKERHSRCYLVGRMSKAEPNAVALIEEMVKRVARYIVFVYDFEQNKHGMRKVVAQNDEAEDPWITRTRSSPAGEELQDNPWQVEWSLKHVHQDLATIKALKDRNMICDYYEFVIIDRAPGAEFQILDNVADALFELSRCHDAKEIIEKAVKDTIPTCEQQQWLESIILEGSSLTDCNTRGVNYEGNRIRSWGVVESDGDYLRRFRTNTRSRSDVRITKKIVVEMESCGLITPLATFEPADACPIVLQGDDGLDDVYFDYDLGPIDEPALRKTRVFQSESFASGNSLFTFAQKFKLDHANAVFAKGRIHVHYCAWPMPAIKHHVLGIPTFRTAEGHLFRWNVLPFD